MTKWKKQPDSTGDWLWVMMWSCGCCVRKCGIATVYEYDDSDNFNEYGVGSGWEQGDICLVPSRFLVCFEGLAEQDRKYFTPTDITGWLKTGLPPYNWEEERELKYDLVRRNSK